MSPSDKKPTAENATLLQGFEWNVPADKKHWQRLRHAIPGLKATGIDNLWLPPACKASSPEGNGYDIYDLYDLGEFDQKGGKATKWGTKEELMELVKKADSEGVGIYWDAVLNHKAGADKTEKCKATEVDSNDRTKVITDPYDIEAWVGFDFPGRGDKYSSQKYHWYHFTGTDFNAENKKKAVYKICGDGKHWSASVDKEQGNDDYMMFADLDYSHPEVQEDVKHWAEWIVQECHLKGIRFDAVQHYSQRFSNDLINHLQEKFGPGSVFLVGEFWVGDVQKLTKFLEDMEHKYSLFDTPLLNNFSRLSTTENADLRTVFDNTLVKVEPYNAVTLVMNHDTQPGQTVATPIEGFFKPLAYSLILLRQEGYPEVFYGDLYGMKGEHAEPPSCGNKLPDLVLARKLYAYGDQDDYFDAQTCIGFVRRGTWDKKDGLACVMSNAGPGEKKMYVGEMHSGETWTDILGWEKGEIKIGEDGFGLFPCPGTSVAVWVNKHAEGRDRFGKL
ncbi:MAG: hypothetical protein M1834_005571 [Cirrosporium novae-zelandiae]|nr:MAG: hypothetical protein M1834_005571 [Cirrosporium novae-zelandiae]